MRKKPAKRIPIKAAKTIAEQYGQDQVILVTWDKINGRTHVVSYGRSLIDCEQAALGGNFVKKALGWPENLQHATPSRVKRRKL